MGWKTTTDILDDIHGTLQRLRAGGDRDQAHVECRAYHAAAKVLAIELEHARLTSRLQGDVLPGVKVGVTMLEAEAEQARPKLAGKR